MFRRFPETGRYPVSAPGGKHIRDVFSFSSLKALRPLVDRVLSVSTEDETMGDQEAYMTECWDGFRDEEEEEGEE